MGVVIHHTHLYDVHLEPPCSANFKISSDLEVWPFAFVQKIESRLILHESRLILHGILYKGQIRLRNLLRLQYVRAIFGTSSVGMITCHLAIRSSL